MAIIADLIDAILKAAISKNPAFEKTIPKEPVPHENPASDTKKIKVVDERRELAITFAYKLKKEKPEMQWRTVARMAVKQYFPDLILNSRAKKIDSIRNSLKQKSPHRRRKRK